MNTVAPGSALGPLLAAFVLPRGQSSIAWFSLVALLAMVLLADIGSWAKRNRSNKPKSHAVSVSLHAVPSVPDRHPALPARKVASCLVILIALMFSKYFYLASLNSYYMFYLMNKFHLTVRSAQIHLFVFLAAVHFAAGIPRNLSNFRSCPKGVRTPSFSFLVARWLSIAAAAPANG